MRAATPESEPGSGVRSGHGTMVGGAGVCQKAGHGAWFCQDYEQRRRSLPARDNRRMLTVFPFSAKHLL